MILSGCGSGEVASDGNPRDVRGQPVLYILVDKYSGAMVMILGSALQVHSAAGTWGGAACACVGWLWEGFLLGRAVRMNCMY